MGPSLVACILRLSREDRILLLSAVLMVQRAALVNRRVSEDESDAVGPKYGR